MKNNNSQTSLILFDSDLRILDNPAFFYCLKNHQKILPLFILDEKNKRQLGGAAKWFLHHALEALNKQLEENYNLKLFLKKGDSLEILEKIFKEEKIGALYFNRLAEPYNVDLQRKLKELAKQNKVEIFTYKSQTLFDYDKIKTGAGGYFKIFTPFLNACKKKFSLVEKLLPEPQNNLTTQGLIKDSETLSSLNLLQAWSKKLEKLYIFDHKKIERNLDDFFKNKIQNYKQARNLPALNGNSEISPYLAFGLISPKQVFWKIEKYLLKNNQDENINQFLAELIWREFCHHLLFHFPQLPDKPFNPYFAKFPWIEDQNLLTKWQKGETGYPLVDAGMRELWATGFMHNRVRMVVASFLVKHLLIDWKKGEEWFWDCLVDANLANNAANWQWVAGSGADAAPYYRIFNPTLQAQRFDMEGEYIKKWLPQLRKLPKKFILEPWLADEKTLQSCGVELGKNYPKPIVEHNKARDMALTVFKSLRE